MRKPIDSLASCPIELHPSGVVRHPERALARGALVRVRTGVYAPTHAWNTLAPWDRYVARVYAVALVRPDAVFCHESAAALHGLPVFGDPVVVHTLADPGRTARLVSGVRLHNGTDDRDILERQGMLLTGVGATAVDLARFRHPAIGLSAADAALRLDPSLSAEALAALNESRNSSRGRALARWPLAEARREPETAAESVSRAVIHWLGFPAPELQVTFRSSDGVEDRGDFLWPDVSLLGEVDGDLKYDGRFGSPLEVLRKQGARDRRLRTQVRAIAHWGWPDATAFAPLRAQLAGHGLRAIRPEDTAMLFALRRALASAAPHRTAASTSVGEPPSALRARG